MKTIHINIKALINSISCFALQHSQFFFLSGVFLILLLSLASNLYGIKYGLPYVYDPDEPTWVSAAIGILSNRDLNPHEFGHPGSTTIYLLAILYGIIYIIGLISGKFESPQDFRTLYHQDPTLVYLSGRLLTVVFSLALVLLLILIIKKIYNRPIALLAGFFLAINPLFVHYSKFIRTDIQATFWILLTFWFCLNILESHRIRDYIFAGLFSGIAIATKYPALIIVFSIILAHILNNRQIFKSSKLLLLSGLASICGLFISAPFLFIDITTALADIINEARPEHLSATSSGFLSSFLWYIKSPLANSFTWVGLILAVFGIYLIIKNRKIDALLALSFTILFLVFISSLSLRWDRWVIPVIPFIAMFCAVGFVSVVNRINQKTNLLISCVVFSFLLLSIAIPLIRANMLDSGSMAGKHTRTQAAEWMNSNIPPGSRVLMEVYTSILLKTQFQFYTVTGNGDLALFEPEESYKTLFTPSGRIGELSNINLIRENKIEYIVMSHMYSRFKAEGEKYPDVVKQYEVIMSMGEMVFQIDPIEGKSAGPQIRIFRISEKK